MRSRLREYQVTDEEFLSPSEHEGLHNRDSYVELLRDTDGNVTNIEEWYDDSKSRKIKDIEIFRNNWVVTHTITSLYDYTTGSGIIATVTGTVTRDLNYLLSSTKDERDYDMEGI